MGTTVPALPETLHSTAQDLFPVHDYETNTTKKISGKNLQRSVHRFEPIIVTASTITLNTSHETALLVLTNVTSTTVSIDDSVFELGATIHLLRDNAAGPVTGSTVVLRVPEGKLSQARGVNSPMTIYLREQGATEYWNIWGDLKDI